MYIQIKNLSDVTAAISTEKLGRIFKIPREIIALQEVDLEIPQGELFGLLGPNGAGKTTLIKILCTLFLPTSGKAWIKGMDVTREENQIRRIINMVSGGETSGYGILTVRETLWLFAQLYGVSNRIAFQRADEIMKIVGLEDFAGVKVHKLSSGMRQKLNFARGFMNDPEIIFLDEPTLGLDVNASRDLRRFIKEWVKREGKTVLLTTHYMMEADELCDRVAIINRGKILSCDYPANLKKMIKHESIFELELRSSRNEWEEMKNLEGVKKFSFSHDEEKGILSFRFLLANDFPLDKIFLIASRNGSHIVSVRKSEPNLEDVFVELVGRGLSD